MKALRIFLVLAVIPIIISAQRGSAAFKFGYFNPTATEGGFILGYEGGRSMDRNFRIGWSADWFHKSYVDQVIANDLNGYYGIPNSQLNELRAKTNLHEIPVLFTLTGIFPLAPQIEAYGTCGVGVEVLLIFYKNFVNTDENEIEGAFDFAWRLGCGAAYQIGRRSSVFLEFTYHSSKPSWTYNVDDPASNYQKTFERTFDMSGMMTRVGVRFCY